MEVDDDGSLDANKPQLKKLDFAEVSERKLKQNKDGIPLPAMDNQTSPHL